jgi:hypothetical protein
MKSIVAGAFLAFLGLASSANAALTITVPNVTLLPNTDHQAVMIPVSGGDQIAGVSVHAVLGDGTGPGVEPAFVGHDFLTGTIFSGHSGFEQNPSDPPSITEPGFALLNQGETVAASGNFITLFISTIGVPDGTYALRLGNGSPAGNTEFDLNGGATVVPVIINGSVSIPEPSSMLVLVSGGLLLVRRRRVA